MTWISSQQAGMLNPMLKQQQAPKNFQDGLLQWLQSPEAKGLIIGLGEAAKPGPYPRSISEAFGPGMVAAEKIRNADRKHGIDFGTLEETIRHHQALEGLQRIEKDLKLQEHAAKEKRQQMLQDILFNGAGGDNANLTPDQKVRLQVALQTNDTKTIQEILSGDLDKQKKELETKKIGAETIKIGEDINLSKANQEKIIEDVKKSRGEQELAKTRSQNIQTLTNTSSATAGITDDQRRRATILMLNGDTDGAFKILAEKSEKDATKNPTTRFLTDNQKTIQAINNVIPELEDLMKMDIPYQALVPSVTSPDRQAAYEAKTSAIIEQLMNAYNLPSTDQGLKKAARMIEKSNFESDASYRKRLQALTVELGERAKRASEITTAVEPLGPRSNNSPSQDDIEFTARKYGITVDEVKRRLGIE